MTKILHPGCDHCNHPMFAAMRCDVCGKVHSTDDEPQQEAVGPEEEAAIDAAAMNANQKAMIEGRHQYVGKDFQFKLHRKESELAASRQQVERLATLLGSDKDEKMPKPLALLELLCARRWATSSFI